MTMPLTHNTIIISINLTNRIKAINWINLVQSISVIHVITLTHSITCIENNGNFSQPHEVSLRLMNIQELLIS